MTQKDRLIEMFETMFNEYSNEMSVPDMAEYLIENGVILPQCKVGDMVYRIANDGKTISEERVGAIHVEYTIDNGTGIGDVWWLKDYNVGITTFLTREEAEAALKGETKQCAR